MTIGSRLIEQLKEHTHLQCMLFLMIILFLSVKPNRNTTSDTFLTWRKIGI